MVENLAEVEGTMKPNNWGNIVVSPDTPLAEAIEILDREGKRSLLIATEDNVLLGTVSDGDVRRALIRKVNLAEPVDAVMQCTPKVAGLDWSKTRILSFMEQHQLLQLPVLDENNRICDVMFLYDLLQKPRIDNPVCLMAGGFGTRLRPLTDLCPKPMLKLGDKPILELILERFIHAGFHNFYISTHYRSEQITEHFGDGSRYGVTIRYLHEHKPLGTAGALGLLHGTAIEKPLFVMNGDLLTDVNFLQMLACHEEHGGVATMCVREFEQQVPYGVIQTQGSQITDIVEKPKHKFLVNAGIYLLSPELVSTVSPEEVIDMPDLIKGCLKKDLRVNQYRIDDDWIDIGQLDDFKRAQRQVEIAFQNSFAG
ncbi:nucleotidyltransferase family protein [Rheinheimera sp. SA_1]|uniref:nucleotidyltransferase family protein n=1 Tax=Rheinheimera sp. SA_1 TaxID=1827365 RepID=UPI0018D41E8D|nr:nucleotidyltransferase family protein [Rheinheimera sp. SA_1]